MNISDEREKIAAALDKVAATDAVRVGYPLKGVIYRDIAKALRDETKPLDELL